MPYIEWSDDLKLGATDIDGQHKYLVEILNSAYDAAKGADQKAMADVLDSLTPYVIIHFQSEERIMDQSQYPQMSQHRAEHENLKSRVNSYRADLMFREPGANDEIVKFLIDWLRNHILNTDRALVQHLRETNQLVETSD